MGERIEADVSKAVRGLDALEKKMERKFIRQSLRTCAKPTLALSRSTAPERTGLTKQNIRLRSGGVKKGTYRMTVGVGKKDFTGPTFYAGWIVYGHKIGKRELGEARKEVPPNTWLEKAYEATAGNSITIFRETIAELIDNA